MYKIYIWTEQIGRNNGGEVFAQAPVITCHTYEPSKGSPSRGNMALWPKHLASTMATSTVWLMEEEDIPATGGQTCGISSGMSLLFFFQLTQSYSLVSFNF